MQATSRLHLLAKKFLTASTWCTESGAGQDLSPSSAKLNALQEELEPFGLVVLGFPCNQFGKQEPGENSEILPSLKYVRPGRGFVPNFQLFEKGDVNGEKEQKFYTFLKVRERPPPARALGHPLPTRCPPNRRGPDGKPVMRWYHRTTVGSVKVDILAHMRRQAALLAPGK
ncbi:Glutathione peroxidase 3 [Heterocephalus glaber]|uniref:glutathione peroxidase n=1 Tax=Heterocephalus glaber TaxID=10181 RepID=G5BCB2_HETGA|nr:Glutathione peroxidase 3 [Heterocephalus glaber]